MIKNLKKQLTGMAACLLLLPGATALAGTGTLEILNSTAEVDELSLTAAGVQTLFVRECDECPVLALSIDASTQYFDGKRPISLNQAAAAPRGATVFFDKPSRLVSRIVFWQ